MSYKVISVGPATIEVWDGYSYVEPKHRTKSTMTLHVPRPHEFEPGDLVDIKVALNERPEVVA
jgi:hypothetical protein